MSKDATGPAQREQNGEQFFEKRGEQVGLRVSCRGNRVQFRPNPSRKPHSGVRYRSVLRCELGRPHGSAIPASRWSWMVVRDCSIPCEDCSTNECLSGSQISDLSSSR